jgi:hypothetical protein
MAHPTDFGFEYCKAKDQDLTIEQFNTWRSQYLAAQSVEATKYMSAGEIACSRRLQEMVSDAMRIIEACASRGIEARMSTSKNAAGASVYVTFNGNNVRLSDHDCQRAQGVYIKLFYPCTKQVQEFIKKI